MPDLHQLLKGKSADQFSPDQLQSKAHWRWDRGEHQAAFLLFDAAHQRAVETGDSRSARTSLNRAAVTLFLSKAEPQSAIERLEEVICWYQRRPSQSSTDDSHFAEWAATCLLENVVRSAPERFASAFDDLSGRCREAGCRFPSIHPQQDRIAQMAFETGSKDVMRELIPELESRKPMPRQLKRNITAWKAWLSEPESNG